ncbi:beta-galactoside alpha-2,6-sialyltransferase 1-like [Dendropsophus ebraccatus]|uniref:beta-galactoside alpha-2,6-sialyltransferase 1-like n=1 Tax=Dendropsophus ebraccatus TaxID=150705 RepID=UPI0038321187
MVRILRKLSLFCSMALCISYFLYIGLFGHQKYVASTTRTVKHQYQSGFIWGNEISNASSPERSTDHVTEEQKEAQKNNLPTSKLSNIVTYKQKEAQKNNLPTSKLSNIVTYKQKEAQKNNLPTSKLSNIVTYKKKEAQKNNLPTSKLSNTVKSLKYNRTKLWEKEMNSKDLIERLQKQRSNYRGLNRYKVKYKGKVSQQHSPHEILCQLKHRVNITTLKSSDLPDNVSSWSQCLPNKDIREAVGKLKRCAVVSSAASIRGSRLGQEIDSHDAVLRFNAALTKQFEVDVGSKTTLRLMNSQIVTQKEFHFLENSLFKDGILIVWDPSPYNADTYQWYKKPEFKFFGPYQEYRLANPNQPFYILKPQSLWQMWEIIQENSPELIHPNPPSSGSIGILLMMNLCDEVNVYEFLPSSRQSDRCYYFREFFDAACTYGAYHPLIYEKNLIKKLNQGTNDDIVKNGKITLPGLRNLECETPTR